MNIRIHSIEYNRSLVNGPGVRTLLFLQGCDIKCEGCHNPTSWSMEGGVIYDINKLTEEISKKTKNKKITVTGGEPFSQKEAIIELVKLLHKLEFDICIYTGRNMSGVPREILPYLKYIKIGKYDKTQRCTVNPYIGSRNQKFIKL